MTTISSTPMNVASESPPPIPMHLLSPAQLCKELSTICCDSPCQRTIRRWHQRGLPHHPHPGNGRNYYLLHEVVAWLLGEPVAQDYRVRANSLAWRIRQQAG